MKPISEETQAALMARAMNPNIQLEYRTTYQQQNWGQVWVGWNAKTLLRQLKLNDELVFRIKPPAP